MLDRNGLVVSHVHFVTFILLHYLLPYMIITLHLHFILYYITCYCYFAQQEVHKMEVAHNPTSMELSPDGQTLTVTYGSKVAFLNPET